MSLVVHRPEPLMPQCFNCGTRKGALTPCPQGRRYPSGSQVLQCAAHTPATTPVQAATGVITAAMEQGHTAPAEIADAEEAAGILFDPQHAKAIADAAYQQAKAEDAVELAQAAQDREARDWFHARWKTLGQLCEGRHPEDMLRVDEVLAALDARVPTTAPLTLTWDGIVSNPVGDRPWERTLVAVTTARGGQAVLALDFEERVTLGGQPLATAETCTTPGCGQTAEEIEAADPPPLPGWICVQVAGLDAPPRWWCSPWCVTAAIAAAGAELAAVDQAGAVDPNEPVAYTLTPDAGPVPYALTEELHDIIAGASESAAAAVLAPATDGGDDVDRRFLVDDEPADEDDTEPDFHRIDDDEPHCARCGCSARRPCPGGCLWIPNTGMADLCSRCATPQDLTSATGGGL